MSSLFPSIVLLFSCDQPRLTDGSSTITEAPSQTYTGKLATPKDCPHSLNIDVIEAGRQEPIFFTKAEDDGTFTLEIPQRESTAPLSIHGFCYASEQDVEDNVQAWHTEPYLLLSSHDPTEPIVLSLAGQTTLPSANRSEPAIQETIPTEYSTWAQNPFLVQFYGLRFPDHKLTTSGSLPEIRQGGLTVATHQTYIQAIIQFIQHNTDPAMSALLLPSPSQLTNLQGITDPTDSALQIIHTQLTMACATLQLPCPAINNLRQQQWILKDKSTLNNPLLVQTRANLWFQGHRLIEHCQQNKLPIPTDIPLPSELATINSPETASPIQQRLTQLYRQHNLDPPDFAKGQ